MFPFLVREIAPISSKTWIIKGVLLASTSIIFQKGKEGKDRSRIIAFQKGCFERTWEL